MDWFVATALGPGATPAALAEGGRQGRDVGPEILAATVAAQAGSQDDQAALVRRAVAAVRCPVRVVAGERDEVCPPQWSVDLAAAPHTEAVLVPGAGHCPHVTDPGGIAHRITTFALSEAARRHGVELEIRAETADAIGLPDASVDGRAGPAASRPCTTSASPGCWVG